MLFCKSNGAKGEQNGKICISEDWESKSSILNERKIRIWKERKNEDT